MSKDIIIKMVMDNVGIIITGFITVMSFIWKGLPLIIKRKTKIKIYKYLQINNKVATTQDICSNVFKKKGIDMIYNCLIELSNEGLIRKIRYDGETKTDSMWICLLKQ